MVLQNLGNKIAKAIKGLGKAAVIDEAVLKSLLDEIGEALSQSDVNAVLIEKLKLNVTKKVNLKDLAHGANKQKLVQKTVIEELTNLLDPGKKPYKPVKGKSNIIVFVGLQGAGKTTCCMKMAYWYKRKGWSVGLVCADTYRAGAYDQTRHNALRAKVPFYGDPEKSDPAEVAADGVEVFKKDGTEIIIVDTSGRHKQEAALFEEMQAVVRVIKPDDIIFVMDSTIGQAAADQAQAFGEAVEVGSVIITKLDGHAKGGGALSAVAQTKSPIIFIGTGERVDEFEAFNNKSFVSRILGMGDLTGLMNRMKELKIGEGKSSEDLMIKIAKGELSLRDMRDQFKNLMKLGNLKQVMGMIPGFNQIAGNVDARGGEERIRTFMIIFDSMTAEELDSDGRLIQFSTSRKERIARGSGVLPGQVDQLLLVYKPFRQQAKNMKKLAKMGLNKKGKMPGGGAGGFDAEAMQKMLQGKGIDQNMMQQLSGLLGNKGGIDPNAIKRLQGMMGKGKRGRRR